MRASQSRVSLGVLVVVAGIFFSCATTSKADPFTFTSFRYPGTTLTVANGINNQGQVVGYAAEVPGSSVDPTGFIYDHGSFTPLVYSNSGTQASDINNLGIVVGTSGVGSFLYDSNTGIYTPFSGRGANAINDLGQIVGQNYFFDGTTFHTINFPGADSTTVGGLNNAGELVGTYRIGNTSYGFIDNAGTFTSISVPGAFGTSVTGVNNAGELVGYYFDSGGRHAFVQSQSKLITFDLPQHAPEDNFTTGADINDYGQVTGYWQRGATVSFVATPTPEPATLGLVGTGLLMLGGFARSRVRAAFRK